MPGGHVVPLAQEADGSWLRHRGGGRRHRLEYRSQARPFATRGQVGTRREGLPPSRRLTSAFDSRFPRSRLQCRVSNRVSLTERIPQSMQANDLRKGTVILFEGDLCKVMEYLHHTPGNLRAMVQAKLRNLRTGNQFEHRFRSHDDVQQAYIN